MELQLPDDFKCPISLVILASGHTFDRSSILKWLNAGHRTCPVTKLPLPDHPSLIPNHALRSLICNYSVVSLPNPQQSSPELKPLLFILTSPSSSLDSRIDSLNQLALVCKRDSTLRRKLTESGAVSAILKCVVSNKARLQEEALSLLLKLSLDDDNKVGLVAEGAIGGRRKKLQLPFTPFARFLIIAGEPFDCGAVPILLRAINSGLERAVQVLGLLAKGREGR